MAPKGPPKTRRWLMNVPAQRPVPKAQDRPAFQTDRRQKVPAAAPLKNIRVRFEKLRISLPEERESA